MTVNEKINIPDRVPVILIAPLDWGLGHATRCIPIIKQFLLIGCEVIIASEGRQQALLKQEFTNIRFVHLIGYRIKYSDKSWQTVIKIFLQVPKMLVSIRKEHKWVNNFLRENRVSAIISDNRYGFYSRKVPSIFITHQLTIKSPFGSLIEKWIQKLNYYHIQRFTECWVPDYEGNDNLAGELSHPRKYPRLPVKFLGRLSRMQKQPASGALNQLLLLLSGPEPQRTIFENILLDQLNQLTIPAVLVRGLPGEKTLPVSSNKNLVIYNHLSAVPLSRVVNDSIVIISRPGYSSVMDLAGLNKKCVFVPTPGQPEQEYLARYLSSRKFCVSFSQNSFSLQEALSAVNQNEVEGLKVPQGEIYKEVVEEFVKRELPPNGEW